MTQAIPDVYPEMSRAAGQLGLPADEAFLLALFALSTWFADILPACPTLLLEGVTGPCADSLISWLRSVCRHSLQLAELTPAVLTLPEQLCPTLFFDGSVLGSSAMRLLASLRSSESRFLRRGQPVRFAGSHVVRFDYLPDGGWADQALHIGVPATAVRGGPSALKLDFQAELLGYRLAHYRLVKESTFAAETLDPSLQALARDLGRCVAAYPELQEQVVRALQARSEHARAARSGGLEACVLEALISEIHGGASSVRVARLCENANHILLYRGEQIELGNRQVGAILSSLGFLTERLDRLGRGLRLTKAFKARVHELARLYHARAMDHEHPGCPWCSQQQSSSNDQPADVAHIAHVQTRAAK